MKKIIFTLIIVPLILVVFAVPVLAIVTAPVIVANVASEVSKTTARLNSIITDDGTDTACEIRFGYGTTSHTAGDFALYDTVASWDNNGGSGYEFGDRPYLDVTGLTANTPYYYRVQIKNTDSTVTSSAEITFTTSTNIADITNLYGLPSDTSITLSWVRGAGAGKTMIRYQLDTYPSTVADGKLAYFGTATTYEHTGLTAGTTYYYSAWGESGSSYSTNKMTFVMTTTAEGTSAGSLPTPTNPSEWNQVPDETKFSQLEPFYSLYNNFADDWGVQRPTAWLGAVLVGIFALGITLYIKLHAPGLSLTVMILLMIGSMILGLLPMWMIFVVIIMGIGVFSLQREAVGA